MANFCHYYFFITKPPPTWPLRSRFFYWRAALLAMLFILIFLLPYYVAYLLARTFSEFISIFLKRTLCSWQEPCSCSRYSCSYSCSCSCSCCSFCLLRILPFLLSPSSFSFFFITSLMAFFNSHPPVNRPQLRFIVAAIFWSIYFYAFWKLGSPLSQIGLNQGEGCCVVEHFVVDWGKPQTNAIRKRAKKKT